MLQMSMPLILLLMLKSFVGVNILLLMFLNFCGYAEEWIISQ